MDRLIERAVLERWDLWDRVLALPPRQMIIIVLRYGLDGGPVWTFRECGLLFGFSRQRAHEIHGLAIDKLRASYAEDAECGVQ